MRRLDKLYLGTNTKMYQTIADSQAYLQHLCRLTSDIPSHQLELFVIPPYTALDHAVHTVAQSKIRIGAQNMCWQDSGQFTGEISPLMLKEIGVEIVMAGHSERRQIFGETDILEKNKIKKICQHNFIPLLCIGETKEEKEFKVSDEILAMQLKIGLHEITQTEAKNLWIAYEPVWSIGVHGQPADKQYANKRHQNIRQVLISLFGAETGSDIPILYGGSVSQQNAADLIQMPYIDGLFIGRSAWDPEAFNKLIRTVLPLFYDKRIERD